MLKKREVVYIDIATDPVDPKEYKEKYDPTLYHSAKTGRGPLQKGWQVFHNPSSEFFLGKKKKKKKLKYNCKPVMCCYKLVTLKFNVFGFQSLVEGFTPKVCFTFPPPVEL